MTLANVRKARAGTDSAGHRWPADGAVIAVPVEHALAWTRITDGGFSIIETPPAVGTVPAPVTGVTDVVADDIDETGPDGTEAKPRTSKAATRRS